MLCPSSSLPRSYLQKNMIVVIVITAMIYYCLSIAIFVASMSLPASIGSIIVLLCLTFTDVRTLSALWPLLLEVLRFGVLCLILRS